MNAHQIAIGSAAFVLFAGSSPALAQSGAGRQPIRQHMTCGEFLRSDELAKPEIVYWLAIRGAKDHGATLIDADTTDGMVAALVERCRDAPTTPLSQQLKAEAEKLRSRL